MVTLPASVAVLALTYPLVLMFVDPLINDAPVIVLAVTIPPLRTLLVSVAEPASVTTTPVTGKVADELIPVPPREVGNNPVTAAGCARFNAPKAGAPPFAEITRVWNGDPAAVEDQLCVLMSPYRYALPVRWRVCSRPFETSQPNPRPP